MGNILTLYHGTDHILEKPCFGKGKTYNDYGLGFYCTKSLDLAKEWSVDGNRDGFVNKYEIDITGLQILNLNKNDYPMLKWLSVLIENRTFDSYTQLRTEAKDYLQKHFSVDYKSYDLIVGYRADDSYFQFAKDFLDGEIPYSTLSKAMMLGRLGNQYVLKSRRAFDLIKFVSAEPVKSAEWFPKKQQREQEARMKYRESKSVRLLDDDIFMLDILRGKLSDDDKKILRQGVFARIPEGTRSDD